MHKKSHGTFDMSGVKLTVDVKAQSGEMQVEILDRIVVVALSESWEKVQDLVHSHSCTGRVMP